MLPYQSLFVMVHGTQAHYLLGGKEGGQPVLLLHGASFSAETWHQIHTIQVLAEAGYRVFAVDLPGHGKSEKSQASHEDWLRNLLDALGIKRPVIVSPSMSGSYALPLVVSHPSRISGFVAVAPVAIMTYRDRLNQITVPVLAIWGEKDHTIPLEQADLLVRSVKDGKKAIIAGGSHAPYMSNPDAFHKVLLDFLGKAK